METESTQAAIEALLDEQRTFPPPEEFTAGAIVQDDDVYKRAEEDSEGFWRDLAGEFLGWFKEPTKGLEWDPPHCTWFADGELNVAWNCLDRHVEAGRADRVAYHWVGEPADEARDLTYGEMLDGMARHTKIEAHADGCTGFTHCHHEKTIVIDGRVAFVGGIDLTLDGGDPWDTPSHIARGGIGWHDAAVRIEGPAVADVANHFRLRWHGSTGKVLPRPEIPEQAGDVEAQVVRTLPAGTYRAVRRGDYSILESYIGALRSAERFVYIENQFLWSPEIVSILAQKLENPPSDDFRVLVVLPARANDGADISRGQVAALIHAADESTRFLACTIYARSRNLRDPVYIHAKIGIVDDRWLTVGSANLNAHSLFHDTEMNVVTHDPDLARATRLRLWSEHLELPLEDVEGDPITLIDEHWERIASEQLELLEGSQALTHRLVKLPGVSRRRRRVLGPLQSHLYDV